MTEYLHIGGEHGGKTLPLPANTPGLNYKTENGTSYNIHKTEDNTYVYGEASLCWRDVNTFYRYLVRTGKVQPSSSEEPQLPTNTNAETITETVENPYNYDDDNE